MGYILYPDSILENWGIEITEGVLCRSPFCLLERDKVSQLVEKLLDDTLQGALLSTDFVKKIDPYNGLERRAKAAGHVKIILESLGRDNTEFDAEFIENGYDMIEVWKYYLERRNTNSFYKTGLVSHPSNLLHI